MKGLTFVICTLLFVSCGDMWNEKRYDRGEFNQQREQVEDENDIIQVLPEEKESSDQTLAIPVYI